MVRYVVLVGDGMADFPLSELDNRTPLEVAFTPSMDELARMGVCGLFCPIPSDTPPGSDIGNLSLFGYDPKASYTGRAPLEAANQGITLAPNQVAFRCNLVTLRDGRMADFTSGHISSEESAQLMAALNDRLRGFPVYFSPGVGYRNLAIVTAPPDQVAELANIVCTPPHDITDQPYADYLPSGPGSEFPRALMEASRPVLGDHPVNRSRVAEGKNPATSVWLWGQGLSPNLQSYRERFGLTGAVISAVDLVNGIGVAAGLNVIKVPGATGYLDTNYKGKVSAAQQALREFDFVYLHVEAPDETSHQGRTDLKIRAIEDFDAYIVAPFLDYLSAHPHTRILVAPDHVTAISTRTHAHGPVPFVLAGEGVASRPSEAYSESAARTTGVFIEAGHTLLPLILQSERVEFGPVSSSRSS